MLGFTHWVFGSGYLLHVTLPWNMGSSPRIALIATADTKGEEMRWLYGRLADIGCSVLLIDSGIYSDEEAVDVTAHDLAIRAGSSLDELRGSGDRGQAIAVMSSGITKIVTELAAAGSIDGILAIGGSGGSALSAPALQAVPVAFPKLLVSTMASGDTRPYVGASDVTVTYSVVDIAGMNSISRGILDNAAAAIAGMAAAYRDRRATPSMSSTSPVVTMTMFGVTTPAADEARARLDELGYEVLVFHATGSGGMAMEKLIASGIVAGVCDLTTTELCDNLVGGILSAGPNRLLAAGAAGIPQVVSVGALDMVNFGPVESVPDEFTGRRLLQHNPSITLMRTTAEEMTLIGAEISHKLRSGSGPRAVLLPTGGVSSVDVPGQPFHDPDADRQLFKAIRAGLVDSEVDVVEIPVAINDEGFGLAMADRLHAMITGGSAA